MFDYLLPAAGWKGINCPCLALQFCFMERKIKWHGSSVFCTSCCFVLMMEKSHKEIQLFLLCVFVYFVVVVVMCVCVGGGIFMFVLLTNKKMSTLNLVKFHNLHLTNIEKHFNCVLVWRFSMTTAMHQARFHGPRTSLSPSETLWWTCCRTVLSGWDLHVHVHRHLYRNALKYQILYDTVCF